MGRNKWLGWCLVLMANTLGYGQDNRYMVFFADKAGSPHSVTQPETFLSPAAIHRKSAQGVPIDQHDMPVSPAYLAGVRNQGAEVYFATKWMNGVLVQANSMQIEAIEALPFVVGVEYVAPGRRLISPGRTKWTAETYTEADYINIDQLAMLGIDHMHQEGNKGQNIRIAVMDGGFRGVNTQPPFQHLFANQQIAETVDFVTAGASVYEFSDHGTRVLSQLAAINEEPYYGAVPKATYFLYLTEDVASEYRVEEYNWLFAAEKADSAGVHIIQTSLGYTDFDDPSMDYSPADMDGETAIITRAATLATQKGMVVVVSAGNDGNNSWQKISAPADAKEVIAVGAVNALGTRMSFSSIGPSADGRIKPDVMAVGGSAMVINQTGAVALANGTSFSSPLITGLIAGVLKDFPDLSPAQLGEALRMSADRAMSPDFLYGYGIPHYLAVRNYLSPAAAEPGLHVYPNPFVRYLHIQTGNPENGALLQGKLWNSQGTLIKEFEAQFTWAHPRIALDLGDLPKGYYLLVLDQNNQRVLRKLVKF
jgi:serine protease AprX